MEYFAGIDIGAATTKAVVINDQNDILGHAVNDSGADFEAAANRAFEKALQMTQAVEPDKCTVVSTGYGRKNVSRAADSKTEISCHAEGSYHHFPHAHTLIDIGGQDCKVIKINDSGKRTNFKMNRKCAAGTGAFLEDIANRLRVTLSKLDDLARESENDVAIGSYCTVFTGTEILAKIREGIGVPDIVKGVFNSVIKRVIEMDIMEGNIVMTGGVIAHNPFLVKMFEDRIGREIFVPPLPQLTGALGAALFAHKNEGGLDA